MSRFAGMSVLLALLASACAPPGAPDNRTPAAAGAPATPDTSRQRVVYPNGHQYEGEMRNGRPHGQGTLTFMRGGSVVGTYAGAFENGQAHGPAVATFNEGYVGVHRVVAERGCVQVGESWMAIGRNPRECARGWSD